MEMSINQKIKELRTKKGYTLEELGQKVGVSKSTVKKWEDGNIKNMRQNKIVSLAAALDTTPAYLLGYKDNTTITELTTDSTNDEFKMLIESIINTYNSSNDEDKEKIYNMLSAYLDLLKK